MKKAILLRQRPVRLDKTDNLLLFLFGQTHVGSFCRYPIAKPRRMRRVSSLSFHFSLLQFYHFYPRDLLKIPDVGCGDGGPDASVDPANHQIESVFRCDPAVLP